MPISTLEAFIGALATSEAANNLAKSYGESTKCKPHDSWSDLFSIDTINLREFDFKKEVINFGQLPF